MSGLLDAFAFHGSKAHGDGSVRNLFDGAGLHRSGVAAITGRCSMVGTPSLVSRATELALRSRASFDGGTLQLLDLNATFFVGLGHQGNGCE